MRNPVLSLMVVVLMAVSVSIQAAAKTDIRVKNYRGEEVTILYKMPGAEWKHLGTISGKSARVFRNVTIGVILKAEGKNNKTYSHEFTVGTANKSGEFVYSLREKKQEKSR